MIGNEHGLRKMRKTRQDSTAKACHDRERAWVTQDEKNKTGQYCKNHAMIGNGSIMAYAR